MKTGSLVAVGGFPAGDRDLGLAYAQMAARGDREAAGRAAELLGRAENQPNAAQDHELHAQLGFLDHMAGQTQVAAQEYRQALLADPNDSLAAGNLALIEAGQHHLAEAARLWNSVFSRDPAELGAGLNLAVVQCQTGQRSAAEETLSRLLYRARQRTCALDAGGTPLGAASLQGEIVRPKS